MLLDRERVKAWQKWIYAAMAVIMVLFLVMIPGQSFACGGATSASEEIAADIAKYQAQLTANAEDVAALRALGDTYLASAAQQAAGSEAQKADYRAAIAQYEKAVEVLAAVKGADAKAQRVELLKQIADVYLSLDDRQAAANVYPRIIKLTPKDAGVYFDWASIAVSAGDTTVALLAFTRFLELDPESSQADAVKQWIQENTSSPTSSPSPNGGG